MSPLGDAGPARARRPFRRMLRRNSPDQTRRWPTIIKRLALSHARRDRPRGSGHTKAKECLSKNSDLARRSWRPSRPPVTPKLPPSRRRQSRTRSPAAIFSASPRRAPARPQPSRCRCCRGSKGPRPRAHAAHARSSSRPANSRRRSRKASSSTASNHKLNVALLIGGVSFGDQETKIMRGADVLIATPGRLLDFSRTRQAAADRHRDPRHRRSRPHARHGLHPGHRADLQAGAVHAPDAVLLGDHAARDHSASPSTSCTIRCASKSPAPARRRATINAEPRRLRTSGGAKRETLRQLMRERRDFKNAIIFCNRKRDVAILHKSLQQARLLRRRPARRHGPARAHGLARRLQARRRRPARVLGRRGARPRHSGRQPRLQLRRADPSPRITSTASAAPAAPASRASRSRSSPTKTASTSRRSRSSSSST